MLVWRLVNLTVNQWTTPVTKVIKVGLNIYIQNKRDPDVFRLPFIYIYCLTFLTFVTLYPRLPTQSSNVKLCVYFTTISILPKRLYIYFEEWYPLGGQV